MFYFQIKIVYVVNMLMLSKFYLHQSIPIYYLYNSLLIREIILVLFYKCNEKINYFWHNVT